MTMLKVMQLPTLWKRQIGFYAGNQIIQLKQHFTYKFVGPRLFSSQQITNSLTCVSTSKKLSVDKNTFRVVSGEKRPLLIILCWLVAKRKHYMKFAEFYMQQGFDVITVTLSPWQLVWPTTGAQVVARDLLKFMYENQETYDKILLHGFSIGGYVWGEVLSHIHEDLKKNERVIENVKGQIWDSAADISEFTTGTPMALLPNNPVLQRLLQAYLEFHLKTFHKQTTQHFIRSSQLYHASIIRAPALFIVSKNDPIGTMSSNLRVKNDWESRGIQTYMKVFEKSPHVGHFVAHPREYITELRDFLQRINLIQDEEKIDEYLRARFSN